MTLIPIWLPTSGPLGSTLPFPGQEIGVPEPFHLPAGWTLSLPGCAPGQVLGLTQGHLSPPSTMRGEALQGLHCSPQGLGSEFPIVPGAGQGPEREGASPTHPPPLHISLAPPHLPSGLGMRGGCPITPCIQTRLPRTLLHASGLWDNAQPACLLLPGSHHRSMAWARTGAEDSSVPTLHSSPGLSVLPGTQGPEWAQWTRCKVEDNIRHDAGVQPPSCPSATTAQHRDCEERGLQQHELRVLLPMHSLTAPPQGSGRGSWSGAGPSALPGSPPSQQPRFSPM